MTSGKARECQPEGAAGPVFSERFHRVVGAGRLMPAARAEEIKHRRQRALVKPERAEGGFTLLTTGAPLATARQWLRDGEYPGYGLFSLPLWGMQLKAGQQAMAARFQQVVTVEDHIADAGFGSWMREALDASGSSCSVISRALSADIFGNVGSQKALNSLGGL